MTHEKMTTRQLQQREATLERMLWEKTASATERQAARLEGRTEHVTDVDEPMSASARQARQLLGES